MWLLFTVAVAYAVNRFASPSLSRFSSFELDFFQRDLWNLSFPTSEQFESTPKTCWKGGKKHLYIN